MVSKGRKHLFASMILILIFTFVSGVLIGTSISNAGVSELESLIKYSELNTESYVVEQALIKSLGKEDCNFSQRRLEMMSTELSKIGRTLTAEEDNLDKIAFNQLKRKYHIMQTKTYVEFHNFKNNCGDLSSVVLFYYKDDVDSLKQGQILDLIVDNYPVNVFAVEYNYSKELDFLQDYYNVEQTPSLVINYDKVFTGLTDYEKIEDEI